MLLTPLHFYNHFLCDLVSLPHQSVLSSLTHSEVNLYCYVVPEIIATSTFTNQALNVFHHYLWQHFTGVSSLLLLWVNKTFYASTFAGFPCFAADINHLLNSFY